MPEHLAGFLAATPEPPYVAVIFTACRAPDPHGDDDAAYAAAIVRMRELVAAQPGFLGVESAGGRDDITVSYWSTEDDARAWRRVVEHAEAQRLGRERWYAGYELRVATVTRAASFRAPTGAAAGGDGDAAP